MARYLLFTGERYYPSRGAESILAVGDSLEVLTGLALKNPEDNTMGWFNIYDTHEGKIVVRGDMDNDQYEMRVVEE